MGHRCKRQCKFDIEVGTMGKKTFREEIKRFCTQVRAFPVAKTVC